MRPIAPLDLPDLVPAPLAGVSEPMFDRLAPTDLLVDEAYQRELSPRSLHLIRSIVAGWDWLKFKPPVVALTDLGFEVVDGQHTAIAAACHPEIATLPVILVDGSDLPRRARAFVSHARDRVAVTPGQVFQAEVAAGDAAALVVDRICARAGVRILPFSPPFGTRYLVGDTTALSTIKGLVRRRGEARAEEILDALSNACLAPITADHIKAAEALCCESEYASDFDPDRVSAVLKTLGGTVSPEVKALAAAKCLPTWRALAAILFKHRNARPRPADRPIPVPAALDAGEAAASAPVSSAPRGPASPRIVLPLGEPAPGRSALDRMTAGVAR